MERYYGNAGGRAVARYLEGAFDTDLLAQLCPLSPLALQNALGVVVHNKQGLKALPQVGLHAAAYATLPYAPTGNLTGRGSRVPVPLAG